MKKFLLAAVIMLASTNVFAQYSAGSFTVQPRIGFSAADFNNTDDTKARVGLVVGPEFEYFVTDKFSLAGGVLYSQQGAEIKNLDVTWEIDYLNIPVTANFYVLKGLALKAGIQPGFLVTKKAKYDGTLTAVVADESASKPYTESVTISDAKGFAFAIPVGLSYEYANFVLDARYNIGVTKAIKEYDCRHSVFSFTLGYKFAL